MGSKKKATTTSNQQSTSKPLDIVMPGFGAIANHVTNTLPSLANINYEGDFTAQPGAMQQGVPDAYQYAAEMARSLVPQAQQAMTANMQGPTFEGPGLDAGIGSFAGTGGMDAAVTAAIQPYMRQLTEGVLPSLQSSGIESGAYGGTRAQETLPALAIRDAGRQAQEIAAGMRYQDFNDTANRNLQAYGLGTQRGLGEADILTQRLAQSPELLDTIMRMAGGSAELQAAGGAAELANQQALIDNNMGRFQYQMNRPFMGYDTATDLLTRLTAGYGNQTQQGKSTTVEKTGGLAPIMAGAMGLASMVGKFPMPGGGSLGGSLVSSLFGKKGG